MRDTLTLFSLFQKLEYRDRERSGFKKLIGIIFAYLFSNTILSFSFNLFYDEKSFVIMSFTSNLFLLSMVVINDFGNLFLAVRNIEMLKPLPLKINNIFSAKFLSTAVYLLLFIITASLPQLVFFYFITDSILLTVSFFFVNILFCYSSVGIISLIYSIIILYFKKAATVFLNLFQLLFFVFIFYTTSAGRRSPSFDKPVFMKQDILETGFYNYFPQTYFSDSVYDPKKFLIILLGSIGVIYVLHKFISKKYFILLEKSSSISKKKSRKNIFPQFKKYSGLFSKLLPGGNVELATFRLVRDHLKNSRYLRLKYFPLLFIPVIIVVIGIFSKSDAYLFFDSSGLNIDFLNNAILMISPSVTITVILCARILISNTKILDNTSTGTKWIFDSLPSEKKSSFIRGADSFVYFIMIMPMLLFIFILISFKTDLLTLLLNFIYISVSVYFLISISAVFDKIIPFTLENSDFNSSSKFVGVILSMILGTCVFLFQIFVFQNIIFVLTASTLFLVVSYFLNRN